MRIKAFAVGAAVAALASSAIVAGPAIASQLDQTSAASFIAQDTAYLNAAAHREQAIRAGGSRFLSAVRRGCANLLPISGSSPSEAEVALAFEASFELALAEVAPIERLGFAFATSVARLHWDDGSISRLLSQQAGEERAIVRIRTPSLCRDIRTAAADGFATVPADTSRFIHAFRLTQSKTNAEADLLRLLKGYSTPADSAAYASLQRTAPKLQRALGEIAAAQVVTLESVIGSAPYP